MGTFTNPTRDTDIVVNPPLSNAGLTWDEATFTWNEATGTWDNPYSLSSPAKNTSVVSNPTKD